MKSKQSGVSLVVFLVMVVMALFFVYMAVKLVPAYAKYLDLVHVMKQETRDNVNGKTPQQLRSKLLHSFSLLYVDDSLIKRGNVTITRKHGVNWLNVFYDKQVPFMYNIDLLIHFRKSLPLHGNMAY